MVHSASSRRGDKGGAVSRPHQREEGGGRRTRHSAAKGDKGDAQPNSPASLAEGIKEVRSPGRTKEGKGAGWYIQQDV